jgi:hypothetical protein
MLHFSFKRHILFLIFIPISIFSNAQEIERPARRESKFLSFVKSLNYGGSIGGGIGSIGNSSSFSGEISPLVGKYIADGNLFPGIGFTYLFARESINGTNFDYSYYGPRIFADLMAKEKLPNYYIHAEAEALNVPAFPGSLVDLDRIWITNFLAGVGSNGWSSERRRTYFMLLYVLNYENNKYVSPYPLIFNLPLVLRFGVIF